MQEWVPPDGLQLNMPISAKNIPINTRYENKGFAEKEYREACLRQDVEAVKFYRRKIAYALSCEINSKNYYESTITWEKWLERDKQPWNYKGIT